MTSKEALKKIYNTGANMVIGTLLDNFFKEEIKAIAKDLEVLEILKRIDWLVYNNGDKNDFNWYIDINKSMKITEEEANKIKEWLNDK